MGGVTKKNTFLNTFHNIMGINSFILSNSFFFFQIVLYFFVTYVKLILLAIVYFSFSFLSFFATDTVQGLQVSMTSFHHHPEHDNRRVCDIHNIDPIRLQSM